MGGWNGEDGHGSRKLRQLATCSLSVMGWAVPGLKGRHPPSLAVGRLTPTLGGQLGNDPLQVLFGDGRISGFKGGIRHLGSLAGLLREATATLAGIASNTDRRLSESQGPMQGTGQGRHGCLQRDSR